MHEDGSVSLGNTIRGWIQDTGWGRVGPGLGLGGSRAGAGWFQGWGWVSPGLGLGGSRAGAGWVQGWGWVVPGLGLGESRAGAGWVQGWGWVGPGLGAGGRGPGWSRYPHIFSFRSTLVCLGPRTRAWSVWFGPRNEIYLLNFAPQAQSFPKQNCFLCQGCNTGPSGPPRPESRTC